MRRNKPGLADLKSLRRQAESPEPDSRQPAPVRRIARKRSPFLPPSAPGTGSQGPEPVTETRRPGSPTPTPSTAPLASATPAADRPRLADSQAAGSTTPTESLLSEADRKLFRVAVRYVDKLKDPGRVLLAPVASAPAALLKERRLRAAGLENPDQRKRPAPGREHPAPDAATTQADTANTAAQSRRHPPLSDTYTPAANEQDDRQYLKPGHGPDVLKDLKRGKWPIGASLDLHGSTVEDARERFGRFVASCLAHDVKCVRIVHGKGHGSRNGDAVLKSAVRRWLVQLASVIAYTECAPADGGSGAVQVLLHSPDD